MRLFIEGIALSYGLLGFLNLAGGAIAPIYMQYIQGLILITLGILIWRMKWTNSPGQST